MTLEQQIENILRTMYNSGQTQDEMAKTLHISQQYIQRLLSGQRNISGLTVKVLMKMFPQANLNVNGDNVVADNSGTAVSSTASVEDFRNRALKTLMDLDISPDALIKVLKTIKDLQI